MNKGTKVKIATLVTDRGTVLESVRHEHERGIVGRITNGPDVMGWYCVDFPSVPHASLQVAGECLIRVR